MRFLISLLIWTGIVCFLPLIGQTDIVVLPDGTEVVGKLIEFKPGERLVLKVTDTDEVRTFTTDEYERLLQLGKRKVSMTPGDITSLSKIVDEAEYSPAILYMTDKSEVKGKIVSYERGGDIRVEVSNGMFFSYPEDRVAAISYEGGKALTKRHRELSFLDLPRPTRVYEFRERGYFNHTSFAFTFGKTRIRANVDQPIFFPVPVSELEQRTTGFNIQHIIGYQFNRWIGAGAGVAYDMYNLEGGEGMITIMGHYRAYLTKTIRAPYFGVNVGYGIPTLDGDQVFLESEGGLMFHPELGIRLGANEKANFTLAVGYRWQDAYYVQEEPFSRDILYRDLVYRRFVLNIGMVF